MRRYRTDVAKQLLFELADSRLQNGAAALAFYSMLSIFPTAIVGLSLLPYLPIPNLQQAIFDLLGELMPLEAADLFRGTVQNLLSQRNAGILSFGLLFGVWSATSGVLASMEQLDVVQRADRPRGSLRARGIAFVLLFPLSLLVVVAFGLIIFGGILQEWLGAHMGTSAVSLALFAAFRWLVIIVALLSAIALLYRVGPTRSRPFRWISAGSVFATLGILLTSFGFSAYVERFGSYDALYGSIGAMIVLLIWLFAAGWVFLMGAAIDNFIAQRLEALGDRAASSPDASRSVNRSSYPGPPAAAADSAACSGTTACSQRPPHSPCHTPPSARPGS